MDILAACGIETTEAQQLAEELNTDALTRESLPPHFDAAQDQKAGGKRRSRRKQKNHGGVRHSKAGDDGLAAHYECQHCGSDGAVVACMSCATGGRPSSTDAMSRMKRMLSLEDTCYALVVTVRSMPNSKAITRYSYNLRRLRRRRTSRHLVALERLAPPTHLR